jgi:hypothetical protein
MLVALKLRILRVVGAVVTVAFFSTASQSSVLPIFSTQSDTITAGQKGVLNLHLDLLADPGNYGAEFAGGSLTFYSGNGAQTQFDLGSGGTSRNFSYAFDYASPGTFAPSFMLSGSYTEKHDESVYLYDKPQTTLVMSNKCGFLCVTYVTTLIPVYGTKTFSDSHAFDYIGSLSLQAAPPLATPLPAALPLYATGLGLIALLAWRKRRRSPA